MNILRIFILLLLAAPMLEAQGLETEELKKTKGRRIWLAATHLPKRIENPVTVMVGKKFHKVPLSKRRASHSIPLGGEEVVRLVRQIPKPGKPDEFTIRVLAHWTVPAKMREALVILIPAVVPNSNIQFHAKVQDLSKYRGGDYLFLNLSPTNVAVQLGEKKIGIAPGETTIYDASSIRESTNAAVQYHFFDLKKQKWQLISASTIVLRPTRRELCVFSWSDRYQRMSYHGITFPVER